MRKAITAALLVLTLAVGTVAVVEVKEAKPAAAFDSTRCFAGVGIYSAGVIAGALTQAAPADFWSLFTWLAIGFVGAYIAADACAYDGLVHHASRLQCLKYPIGDVYHQVWPFGWVKEKYYQIPCGKEQFSP